VHWLEKYWYKTTKLHLILTPISLIFRLLTSLRRAMYQNGMLHSEQLLLPVIVIGNISVGGTGKTPLTLAIAQQLIARGWRPIIISRGYAKKSASTNTVRKPSSQQVTPNSNVQRVGDEPLLMASRQICPVWVGIDRIATAHAAIKSHPGCNVILCDDGLQHYHLRRDVEIAVVDGARRFGNGQLLPAGPLREPISRLKTVDAVVINGGDAKTGQFTMNLTGKIFYNLLAPTITAPAKHFRKSNNHAVAGIGNPERYFQHLKNLGIPFVPHSFSDHHPYCAADLTFNDYEAILMTEKDAVKCAPFADARFWVLRVDAEIDPILLDHIQRKIEIYGLQTA
jgi:tetraacyldisaccharide 4'-kinase